MKKSPEIELIEYIRQRIIDDVVHVVGRVYTNPPDDVGFPFIRISAPESRPDDEECRNVNEIYVQLNCFSRAGGYTEPSTICYAVKNSLHDAEIVMNDNALRLIRVESITYQDDPDGRTTAGVMRIVAFVEEG